MGNGAAFSATVSGPVVNQAYLYNKTGTYLVQIVLPDKFLRFSQEVIVHGNLLYFTLVLTFIS